VAQPAAGTGRGFYWLPEIEDEVLIAFELGDPRCPYVIGALWNGRGGSDVAPVRTAPYLSWRRLDRSSAIRRVQN